MTGRIVIDTLRPTTPRGASPAKAVVGEAVPVEAVVFKEGHDTLAARALLWAEGRREPDRVVPLAAEGNDQWTAVVEPDRLGRHRIVVQAWTDRHATWAHKVRAKLAAGVDIDVEIAEGEQLVAAGLAVDAGPASVHLAGSTAADGTPAAGMTAAGAAALRDAAAALADRSRSPEERVAPALDDEVAAALGAPELADDVTLGAALDLWVDRQRALVGAWYELFPRSLGGFSGVTERVPALAAAGFDVLYLPPIHPIGTSHRKGPNNTLVAGPGDPGSPWAIGSPAGGHTAIEPSLGTGADLDALIAALRDHGMEVALDYALQCSPDHPWVGEHPEWFHHRPDGSIAYAENPPKKYQDIFPINFWPTEEVDRVALWQACKEILDFWIGRGVHIFRVDNPHTKPIAFWEWVIPAVQADHPHVLFLAEAFTRPAVMAKLAEVGFSQSYTYFTWRTVQHGPEGLWAYLEELAQGPLADYMRPNFWPNTPDILSGPLRDGPPAAFAERLVLAATMSPSYGIYSGFELYENAPASETNEEYLDSEKYQLRIRDVDRPGSLWPLITRVNAIRRQHPALARLRSLRFHPSDNPDVIAYSKVSDDGTDAVLCVVALDAREAVESTLHLDLVSLGLPATGPFAVVDEMTGDRYEWTGPDVFVRLEPWHQVAHVFDLHPGPAVVSPPTVTPTTRRLR